MSRKEDMRIKRFCNVWEGTGSTLPGKRLLIRSVDGLLEYGQSMTESLANKIIRQLSDGFRSCRGKGMEVTDARIKWLMQKSSYFHHKKANGWVYAFCFRSSRFKNGDRLRLKGSPYWDYTGAIKVGFCSVRNPIERLKAAIHYARKTWGKVEFTRPLLMIPTMRSAMANYLEEMVMCTLPKEDKISLGGQQEWWWDTIGVWRRLLGWSVNCLGFFHGIEK